MTSSAADSRIGEGGDGSETDMTCGISPLLNCSGLGIVFDDVSEAPRTLSVCESEPASVEAHDDSKAPSRRWIGEVCCSMQYEEDEVSEIEGLEGVAKLEVDL